MCRTHAAAPTMRPATVPPEFFQSGRRGPRAPLQYLHRGLLFVLLGAAITAALYFQLGTRTSAWWGLTLVAMGLAHLIFFAITRRQGNNQPTR
jgi:hypothetical protein